MPVPHIFAGTAGGTTAQLDADFDYFARALQTDSGGKAGFGAAPGSAQVTVSNTIGLESAGGTAPTITLAQSGIASWVIRNDASTANFTLRDAGAGFNRLVIQGDGAVRGGNDNAQTLGTAAVRWSIVYAGTGAINTSDAREKTAVRAFSAGELNAAKALAAEVGFFKFLSAIVEKGEAGARWHAGMTVQRAIEIMEAHSLDPFAYGFICFDEWEAGDRYSFRPDELLLFIARGFEARLAALEAA